MEADKKTRVLIADDNQSELEALEKILSREGYAVLTAVDGEAALEGLRKTKIDLLLTDLKMPKLGGEELIKLARKLQPDIEMVVITGHGTIEQAVESLREGAYDFIEKPFKRPLLLKVLAKACEKQKLSRQNAALMQMVESLRGQHEIIGKSPNFVEVLRLADQVALSEATVLIQGESGTGKELLADYIQQRSSRKGGPFIKLNCAAMPESLLESELFGYEKGAFTGAAAAKPGRFELADGGTLFLDEVGDMSLTLQAKFLRTLENGEYQRLGATRTLRADVRIVAATNANLDQLIREKKFREDLYYRLNVIQLQIPPLRERRSDIPLLAHHFLSAYNQKNHKQIQGFVSDAMARLENFAWPGNVRQLENVVERAVVISQESEIQVRDFPRELAGDMPAAGFLTFAIGTPLEEVEQKMIEATLQVTQGDKEAAARLLGTSSRTIYRRIHEPG